MHEVSFTGQVSSLAAAEFEYASSEQASILFEHRIGPKKRPARVHSIPPKSHSVTVDVPSTAEDTVPAFFTSHTELSTRQQLPKELPEVLRERALGLVDDAGSPEGIADQCVFLQYYKIKYRMFGLKKISAAAGPDDSGALDPDGSQPSTCGSDSSNGSDEEFIIERDSEEVRSTSPLMVPNTDFGLTRRSTLGLLLTTSSIIYWM